MTQDDWSFLFGSVAILGPLFLVVAVGTPLLVDRPLGERLTARLTECSVLAGLLASCGILALMLITGIRSVPIEFGDWISIPDERFHFHLKFVFDRLSVPFTILTYVLCGTVGKFASKYLHRDAGFQRFFILYALFLLGMVGTSLAGTIETLFFGWELVGLSSALLIAYFQDQIGPVRNGLRVWIVYRAADAAFLIAVLTLHHLDGAGEFDALMGTGPWPDGRTSMAPAHALLVGMLLLIAAAGKSALIPFSGWLPRAMEGPTPSSAIFYGALSVHLGTYLLLRVSPLLEVSLPLRIAVITIGVGSAALGTLAARVQADVKSALAFSSMTQVGLIVVEIGLGLQYLALVHIIGHACLRTFQLLRAPSLLRDYRALENAVGVRLRSTSAPKMSTLSPAIRTALFSFALERGGLDALLQFCIVRPFLAVFKWCDQTEQRWIRLIDGDSRGESQAELPSSGSLEDFV